MQKSQARPRQTRPSRVWQFAFPALLFVAAFALLYAKIDRAEPALRAVVIDTLSTRFDSKVELDSFHVSPLRGFEVSGTGLRLFGKDDPNNNQPGVQPLISAARFSFHLALRDFFRSPKHVDTVYIQGLALNLPPREQRAGINAMGARRKIEIAVDHLVCDRVVLIINTLKPGRLPLEFDIESLKMTTIGSTEPMHFEARLTNPKPVGDIVSSGSFGPWRADSPRDTP
jgi:hypothetical protein